MRHGNIFSGCANPVQQIEQSFQDKENITIYENENIMSMDFGNKRLKNGLSHYFSPIIFDSVDWRAGKCIIHIRMCAHIL
jgi:hypothetical protein